MPVGLAFVSPFFPGCPERVALRKLRAEWLSAFQNLTGKKAAPRELQI